ncbi:zinc-binding dehydrogenase [Rhizobium bangladeshense]|uniref:Zinc-binding dehydrogenase n=1 Tax=Rhizobium bangladeshense TaxID=1138189 RepID=A0ABS7LEV4_9HYPH|nr:zinc-binding dehydrogenase [Rhizobium bangladeshense]MBX4882019.1 zinc-binding dehydrogenase [Rhizobium bangladeshense]MBX4892563.1 zinc-binding dehydrogenase [Rhizobium bangladeshense]MBX4913869.1 zinc-binding dehydrogenase [Rhizobium bangladeshense]MBX4919830.1 zinc-binding dehydrogenase [Rhizobium bangladeshense]
MRKISSLVSQGMIQVHIGPKLPFEQAREAHLMLEGSLPRPKGKIVLVMNVQ